MKTTVIFHSADFDGLFCQEIARKFLPDAALIGWDFADVPLNIGHVHDSEQIYVMDLPIDRVFGDDFSKNPPGEKFGPADFSKFVWIDHHKTAIACHPPTIPGYRIDGVAACRLAWQWFTNLPPGAKPESYGLPNKGEYVNRVVHEPLAVRLAGEYDIWDKRDPNAELFQYGLRSCELKPAIWEELLGDDESMVVAMLRQGRPLQYARRKENESIALSQSFTMDWEGWKFLCINAARYNSQIFTAALKPEHDGMLGFNWDGRQWRISLYNDTGKDFTPIAKKYGGGGHPGACGFQCKTLPFALA